MRRIILILLVGFCFTVSAQALDDTSSPRQDESVKTALGEKLKNLKNVAVRRQPKQTGKAKELNDEIVAKMSQLLPTANAYASDESLKLFSQDLKNWQDTAHDQKQHIPSGELVHAIDDAEEALASYTASLQKTERHTPDSPQATPVTLASLEGEVRSMRRDLDAEKGIVPPWALIAGMIATPLLALTLFAFALSSGNKSRRQFRDEFNLVAQTLTSVKSKQDEFRKEMETLKAADGDLFTRLAELSVEIGAVNDRIPREPFSSGDVVVVEPESEEGVQCATESSAFPISADAYLRKMQHYATVVKPDFQNGILVTDLENRGELVLIDDRAASDSSSFVVPRATQFQMKQDFYTYYDHYFDCERLASGPVWIVKPAIVDRVQDGWMLRTKGVLEVR